MQPTFYQNSNHSNTANSLVDKKYNGPISANFQIPFDSNQPNFSEIKSQLEKAFVNINIKDLSDQLISYTPCFTANMDAETGEVFIIEIGTTRLGIIVGHRLMRISVQIAKDKQAELRKKQKEKALSEQLLAAVKALDLIAAINNADIEITDINPSWYLVFFTVAFETYQKELIIRDELENEREKLTQDIEYLREMHQREELSAVQSILSADNTSDSNTHQPESKK